MECAARNLDALSTNLVVADATRTEKTICLAVTPSLKAYGIAGRARLFEVVQRVKEINAERLRNAIRLGKAVRGPDGKYGFSGKSADARELAADPSLQLDYIVAPPRMRLYEQVSTKVFSIYMKYISDEDIHVYSVDECFMDVTGYLKTYDMTAHELAMTMIRDVLYNTGITATAGIGTNMYLAKVAMDIVAKKAKPDRCGVRIAELDEKGYQLQLWDHTPLTDFWQIGPGKAARLEKAGMRTMGDVATMSISHEEWFYKTFGIDAEILIDHAWGIEPVGMADIKGYHTDAHSLSSGQVLTRPYRFGVTRIVLAEMIDGLCADLMAKGLVCRSACWYAAYDWKSLEENPAYRGPVCMDFYGRLHPRHHNGTVRLDTETNSAELISAALLASFDRTADPTLLFRRLNVTALDVVPEGDCCQLSFFTDIRALEKERNIRQAMLNVRGRFGANAVFKAINLCEGATALARNEQIGGHRK